MAKHPVRKPRKKRHPQRKPTMEPVHQIDKIQAGDVGNIRLTTRTWRDGEQFSATRNFDMDATILELAQQMAYQEIQVNKEM